MFLEEKVLHSPSAAENLCLRKRQLDKQLKSIVASTATSRSSYKPTANSSAANYNVKTNSTLKMAASGHMYVDTRKRTPPNESYMIFRKRAKSRTSSLSQQTAKNGSLHPFAVHRQKAGSCIRNSCWQTKPSVFGPTGSHANTYAYDMEEPFKSTAASAFLLHKDVQSSRQKLSGWEKPPRFLAANYYCPTALVGSRELFHKTLADDLTTDQLVERMQSIIETLTNPDLPPKHESEAGIENLLDLLEVENDAAKKPRIQKTLERVRKEQAEMEKRKQPAHIPKRSCTAVPKHMTAASRVARRKPKCKEGINNCSFCNNMMLNPWNPFKYDCAEEKDHQPKSSLKKILIGRSEPKEVIFATPTRRYSFLQPQSIVNEPETEMKSVAEEEEQNDIFALLPEPNIDKMEYKSPLEDSNSNQVTSISAFFAKKSSSKSDKKPIEDAKQSLIKDWIQNGEVKSWANDSIVRRGHIEFDFPKWGEEPKKTVPPVENLGSKKNTFYKGNRQKQQEEMVCKDLHFLHCSFRFISSYFIL